MTGKMDHPGGPAMPNSLNVELCGNHYAGNLMLAWDESLPRGSRKTAKFLQSLNPRRMVCAKGLP